MIKSSAKSIAASQDDEYWFPYHYVSRIPSAGFRQHFVDSWGINYIATIVFLLDQIEKFKPTSLIDIGCGDGRLSREIHRRFPLMELKGIDYSLRAITLAKAMNQDLSGLQYEQIDITKVPTLNKYDAAILMEVFEHIPPNETSEFLSGVHRLLKKSGVLLLTVPHANKPVEYKHFQHFTMDSITNCLSSHFDVVEIIPFEKSGFARRMLNNILCNRFYVLNNDRLLKYLYDYHEKHLFTCTGEHECQRIFVKAIAK